MCLLLLLLVLSNTGISKMGAVVALMDRASDLVSEVVGSNLGSGRNYPRLR